MPRPGAPRHAGGAGVQTGGGDRFRGPSRGRACRATKEAGMNLEKFTDRARGVVQQAQTLALRAGHQRLVPEHLLKALLEDEQGLSANLIRAAGGDPAAAQAGVRAALAKQPKVSGGDGQIYMDAGLARLLDEAGRLAEKAGDAYVSAERLLMALAMAKETEAAKVLGAAGVRPQTLNAAIEDLRKG